MVYLDNYLLTLNSKYASTYVNGSAKSNVQFDFIGLLRDDADIIRTSLSILNAQIPVSFYIITANNNQFSYIDNTTDLLITIPIGNYDANTLLVYMNSQLASGLVLSINSSNGKLKLSTTTANRPFGYYANASTCAEIFGMGTTSIYVAGSPTGTILNFPFPLNLLGVKKISIKSSSLNIVAFSSIKNGYSDTICTIPADQPAFGMISYTSQNDLNRNLLKQSVIDRIDIQLLDENQNYLDFNNLDWSITICLSNERIEKGRDFTTIKDITGIIKKPLELTKDEEELKLLEN
jgi:hypothetical protein